MTIEIKHLPLSKLDSYTAPFNERRLRRGGDIALHAGIDLPASQGSAVYAVNAGIVSIGEETGYGYNITIRHFSTPTDTVLQFTTRYAHLSKFNVTDGSWVWAGTQIGRSGGTPGTVGAGRSDGPHLHFEILDSTGKKINPQGYLEEFQNKRLAYTGKTKLGAVVGTRTVTANASTGTTPGISPYIASLDSFHPNIQYELTRRSYASDAIHSHFPFVKLTSLSKVLAGNTVDGGEVYCPTLGPHGVSSTSFEDIYTPIAGRSVVGFATKNDNGTLVSTDVVVEDSATETDAPNIPMPGIVGMTTERSTAGPMGTRGGLFKANVKLMAHSVGQLNALLRYFLRPATRVILEFGRMSSNPDEQISPFDWKRPLPDIERDLGDLVTGRVDQRDFIKQYVYGNNGNYDIFIGYVVNFKTNYTGKNTYEIDLTIHSIQQFEVPVKLTGARSLCAAEPAYIDQCKVMDISSYFNTDENWRYNSFDSLLSYTLESSSTKYPTLYPYKGHVIRLLGGSTDDPASYLVSWQFLTDVVMNDDEYGLPSVFQLLTEEEDTRAILKKSLLAPFTPELLEAEPTRLIGAQVSWHEHLRSTDPNTMIIYNSNANNDEDISVYRSLLRQDNKLERSEAISAKIKDNPDVKNFVRLGTDDEVMNVGSLYQGVWINSNAIKSAFSSADTISTAINRLLMAMNSAVEGFWNLQLLSDDTTQPGIHVVDMGMSKPVDKEIADVIPLPQDLKISDFYESAAVEDTPKYLYQFNRKSKRLLSDDIGSELLDIRLEASLPQVIAVQAIAGIGGIAQQGTWEALDVNELKSISLFEGIYPTCNINPDDIRTCKGNPNQDRLNEIERVLAAPPARGRGNVRDRDRDRRRNLETERDKLAVSLAPQTTSFLKNHLNQFGAAILLVENDKTRMMRYLGAGRESRTMHPFNSSNLTKTIVDLTLPGIGGIQLFQAFTVARVPNILDRGYYIVTKVSHEFSTQRGWTTKLQGRFRYKPRATNNVRTDTVDTPTTAASAEVPREERTEASQQSRALREPNRRFGELPIGEAPQTNQSVESPASVNLSVNLAETIRRAQAAITPQNTIGPRR
jgi:hypothetical protein